MNKLEPTYLRYVIDNLVKGTISAENAAALPIGFIEVYEKELIQFYSVFVMCHYNWKEAIVVDIHTMDSTWPIVQRVGEKIKINEILDSPEGYFERTRLIDFPEVY